MSQLLDDARLMLPENGGYEPFFTEYRNGKVVDVYWFCGGTIERPPARPAIGHHKSHCPVRSAPRIIAALEAAERVVEMRFAAWCAHADVITDLAEALAPDS